MKALRTRSSLLVFPGILLAATGSLAAGELWSWHALDYTFLKTTAFDWRLHTRVRTQEGSLQQGRSGTILRFDLRPPLSLITGYYYGKEEVREEWQDFHRVFAGAEARVFSRGTLSLAGRTLAERFLAGSRPDFMRFRHRIRLAGDRRLGPYLSAEWFHDSKGYLTARYSGGLRWRCASFCVVEFGYLYDARSALVGPPRHFITTHVFLEQRHKH